MKNKNGYIKSPVCPSCGQPLRSGFRLNNSVKMVLALMLVGYAVLSVMIFLAGTPPEMRKGCGSFDYRLHVPFVTPNPVRCQETESYLWLKSVLNETGFQIFIGGGLAAGLLIFYFDWFEDLYRKWKAKRLDQDPDSAGSYKYTCKNCGHQWNRINRRG
jgi:hypothetical protein